MSTATDHADDFFMRLNLSDDCLGYPKRVAVVATDVEHVARIVWRTLDEDGMPIVVIDDRGGETLVSRPSRAAELLDRLLRRSRVRVETRANGRAARRRTVDRATLERQLLSAA